MTVVARRHAQMMEETRAKLIQAARKLSRPTATPSMDDLTAKAGPTRGALYHNFGDKKGLLQAVIDQIGCRCFPISRRRFAAKRALTHARVWTWILKYRPIAH
jgi:AcrR family transcriptional regulator